MEKSGKKGLVVLIVILVLIIIGLVCYIVYTGNKLYEVGNTGAAVAGTNKGILVLDETELKDEYNSRLVLKIKNTSDKPIIDVTPIIIYRDVNNMPFHEAWGSRIRYFAPGDERCVEFYDAISEYDTLEIGMMDGDEEKVQYKDMRDQVTFETEIATEPTEDGEYKMIFKGENKSDKDLVLEFQIEYFDGDKLIYEDQFMSTVEANGTIDEYEYYATMYDDGKKFPEGYTYKVTLIDAVEDPDSVNNEVRDISEHEVVLLKKDAQGLEDEDIVERILFRHLDEVYGKKYDSAKIYVDEVYKKGDELPYDREELKEGDILFEATMNIFPSEGTDPDIFLIPNGEYDEDLGYVKDVTRIGTIKITEDGDYYLDDIGTGW